MGAETTVVIGSNCFTGSHVVEALLRGEGGRVVGVSRSPQYAEMFLPYARSKGRGRFEFVRLDMVREGAGLRALLEREKPGVVVQVAALSEVALSHERPVEYFRTNTLAVVELCDYLRRQRWLERYVHISSAEMLGSCDRAADEGSLFNPSTPYAVSKAAADMYINTLIASFGFPATLIRSTNVYGRHQQLFKIIPRTVIRVRQGKKIELHGGGMARKSFVHVRDVVAGLMRTVELKKSGTFHLSVPSEMTVADVVGLTCQRMGEDPGRWVVSVGERLGQDARYALDCGKAGRELGWVAREDFRSGVDEVIQWIDENWGTIQGLPLEYVHRL